MGIYSEQEKAASSSLLSTGADLCKTYLSPWMTVLLNLFLPMYCRQCGERLLTKENNFFCPNCWEGALKIERPFCSHCGKPHQKIVGLGSLSNFLCTACRDKPYKYIDRVWGAVHYGGVVSEAIKLFKFQAKISLAEVLGGLMVEFAEKEMIPESYDCIIPVPLYKTRKRERGFNQAELLAEVLIRDFFVHAVLDHTSLKRIRPTHTQSHLSKEKRAKNVRGAFACTGDSLKGKRVLLIDDVITTGGTVSECARSLRLAEVLKVDAFAIALPFQAPRYDL